MCAQICAHHAIVLRPDKEGFLRPCIDVELCNECGLCQSKCPVNAIPSLSEVPLKVFSGWSNDERIRIDSSSGGAFTEIAKLIIRQGGVVFGAAMDENVEARHIVVDKERDLALLRGSKYVQSVIGDAYKEAKSLLLDGKTVLFSGTPCQIAGLRNFLHKDYENLYMVDLICHGVPSPRVFGDYKKYLEGIIRERVHEVKFRCKKYSWIFYNMGINPHVEENGDVRYSYIGKYYSDPYIRLFLQDNILRPNCYDCQYTSIRRVSDFTIADWWGYKAECEADKDFDRKGVSLLICNTEKAVELSAKLDMYLKERTVEEALRTNPSLRHPFAKPKARACFWKDYDVKTFEQMIGKWVQPEKILLSKWLRYKNKKRLSHFALLLERILRKLRLNGLMPVIRAR